MKHSYNQAFKRLLVLSRLSVFALAAVMTLSACSKEDGGYNGDLPLTDSILLGTWTFDSTSIEYPYQTMTFVKDPKTNEKGLLFSALPEMPYIWVLDGNTVEGQAIYPDTYRRQTIKLYIKGIKLWIEEIPAEEEGEDPTYDTLTYMDVNGLISETHLGYFDTMYSFAGRLWKDIILTK